MIEGHGVTTSAGVTLPNYDAPPLIEVVCGAQFRPLNSLLAPHLGLYWEQVKDEYPKCQEVIPLAPVIERPKDEILTFVELPDRPPLPRVWFIHKNENAIIQVQRDRFLHNWKKANDSEYPSYSVVVQAFEQRLDEFSKFVGHHNLGSLYHTQYELTYINHIPQGEGWEKIQDIGQVFPDYNWRETPSRFLPGFEGLHWNTVYALPNGLGRLYSSMTLGLRRSDGHPFIIFELTARGIGQQNSREHMREWLDVAHEWIVRGFTDLTGQEIQRTIWRRRQ